MMDVCTVEPAALGLAQADVDVMRQLAEFFQAVAPQSSGMIEVGRPEDQAALKELEELLQQVKE